MTTPSTFAIPPHDKPACSPGLEEASQTEFAARAMRLALIEGRKTVSDAGLAPAAAERAGLKPL